MSLNIVTTGKYIMSAISHFTAGNQAKRFFIQSTLTRFKSY